MWFRRKRLPGFSIKGRPYPDGGIEISLSTTGQNVG